MAFGEAPDVGDGIVHYLALHRRAGSWRWCVSITFIGLFFFGRRGVFAPEGHGRRCAQVRGRRHRSDVAGKQNEGAGAVGAGAGRRYVGHDRNRRTENLLHNVTHRLHETAGRIHIDDDELGVVLLSILDTADYVVRGGDTDAAGDLELDDAAGRGRCRDTGKRCQGQQLQKSERV